jgi:hypothetical protein
MTIISLNHGRMHRTRRLYFIVVQIDCCALKTSPVLSQKWQEFYKDIYMEYSINIRDIFISI